MLRSDSLAHRRSGKVRLKDYIEDILASEDLRKTTQVTYESNLRNHVAPYLGDLEVAEITPAQLRAYFGQLNRAGVGPGARSIVYKLLSKAFRAALADELIDRNPLLTIRQ